MTTFRLPLSPHCTPDFSQQMRGIELSFSDPGYAAQVFIDSVELTRSQYDVDPDTMCTRSTWQCEVTATFSAEETACAGSPNPDCPAGDSVQNPIDPPTVPLAVGSFDGWLVSVAGGIDASSPTTEDLDYIESLCVEA